MWKTCDKSIIILIYNFSKENAQVCRVDLTAQLHDSVRFLAFDFDFDFVCSSLDSHLFQTDSHLFQTDSHLFQLTVNKIPIVIELSNIRTFGGVIHAIDGALSPTLNRCDVLSADEQLVGSSETSSW